MGAGARKFLRQALVDTNGDGPLRGIVHQASQRPAERPEQALQLSKDDIWVPFTPLHRILRGMTGPRP